jgi:hypothetical protein
MRGEGVILMASGSTDERIPACIAEMLQLTCYYLGMRYEGSHYSRIVKSLVIDTETICPARSFLEASANARP